jgi:hypothetical protein
MRRRAIQLIGLWAVILTITPMTHGVEFAGGAGTLEDPYQVATAEQLLAIRQNGMLADKHFVLAADIDLDPNQPSHVLSGTLLNLSSGSFDGCGHRISNLQIVPYYGGGRPLATLGPQAIVRNLQLEGVSVVGDFSTSPYDFGVLARQNEGLIRQLLPQRTVLWHWNRREQHRVHSRLLCHGWRWRGQPFGGHQLRRHSLFPRDRRLGCGWWACP